jgi:undecaprenyl phosphate-alpha-L-ara4N flippase subunit ArnE
MEKEQQTKEAPVEKKKHEGLKLFVSWFFVIFTLFSIVAAAIMNKTVSYRHDGITLDRFLDILFIGHYSLLLVRGFTWLFALRRIPLSRAYPVLSLTFPLVLIFSKIFFNEPITVQKVIGSVIIVAGVILVVYKKNQE